MSLGGYSKLFGPVYMQYDTTGIRLGYIPEGATAEEVSLYQQFMEKAPPVMSGLPSMIPRRCKLFLS